MCFQSHEGTRETAGWKLKITRISMAFDNRSTILDMDRLWLAFWEYLTGIDVKC